MKPVSSFLILLFLAGFSPLSGQEKFYSPEKVHEIKITFKEQNWRKILDSLFVTSGDQGRLEGVVTIDGITYQKAGIRYKGYSSYNADEIKNPFNIDLDYKILNQNHLGYVKLKLSNVIQDPSFIREVLSYEIARKYMKVSEAGFANVFVNGQYIGLYTNVEAVDKKFIKHRWGHDHNAFFKGEPDKLEYPFGQNANLAFTHGPDSLAYKPYYNMESVYGWSKLYRMITSLDAGADSVDAYLNIDRALWMHAFNETLLNLDSYIGYSQNYYMYEDENGRFNPILWDMNMSFGSFRESDGSINFTGISIPKIKVLDPLILTKLAISPRPLMTKLFANDTLKNIYLAHIKTILDENIRNGWYYNRAAQLQDIIGADVQADTNKFYSYQDFVDNLNVTVGGNAGMKLYPGIKDLMEARMTYLDKYRGCSGQPVISEVNYYPDVPDRNHPCWITASVAGCNMAYLGYRFSGTGVFRKTTLYDDGNHHDGIAGDGVFGAQIIPDGHTIQYYFYAQNDSAGKLLPERAENEFFTIQPMIRKGDIVINEIQAGNTGSQWIELFNTTSEPQNLEGMRLNTDPVSSDAWFLPDTTVLPKSYLVLLSDVLFIHGKSTSATVLNPQGGMVMMFSAQGGMVDSAGYGLQVGGKTTGRYPNGYGIMTYMLPSKGSYNLSGTSPETGFKIFPNPAQEKVYLELKPVTGSNGIFIYSFRGEIVMNQNITFIQEPSSEIIELDISGLRSGLYYIRLENREGEFYRKLIIN